MRFTLSVIVQAVALAAVLIAVLLFVVFLYTMTDQPLIPLTVPGP